MRRPRLRVRLYLIRSNQTKTLFTRFSNLGDCTVTRTEWGIGKGYWKRDVRRAAKELGLEGKLKVVYFIVGSRYTGKYTGPRRLIESFYEVI